jgi:hypothetical protein
MLTPPLRDQLEPDFATPLGLQSVSAWAVPENATIGTSEAVTNPIETIDSLVKATVRLVCFITECVTVFRVERK